MGFHFQPRIRPRICWMRRRTTSRIFWLSDCQRLAVNRRASLVYCPRRLGSGSSRPPRAKLTPPTPTTSRIFGKMTHNNTVATKTTTAAYRGGRSLFCRVEFTFGGEGPRFQLLIRFLPGLHVDAELAFGFAVISKHFDARRENVGNQFDEGRYRYCAFHLSLPTEQESAFVPRRFRIPKKSSEQLCEPNESMTTQMETCFHSQLV